MARYYDMMGNHCFTSDDDMCRAYGVSLETYRARINYGWNIEDALTMHGEPRPLPTPDEWPEDAGTAEICEKFGLDYRSIKVRTAACWRMDVELPYTGCPAYKDHKGNTYIRFTDMARQYGLYFDDLYLRLVVFHWDLKTALTAPPAHWVDLTQRGKSGNEPEQENVNG